MTQEVEIKGYTDFSPAEFINTLTEEQMYDLFDYIASNHNSLMLELIEAGE